MKCFSVLAFLLMIYPANVLWAQTMPASPTPMYGGALLYDDFNQRFLDPARWNTACWNTASSQECVNEIHAGKLRLARRVSGARDSDSGIQFGAAVALLSTPASVKSITSDVVVKDIQEAPCTANPSFGGSASIVGIFFNAGFGDPNADVGASLLFGRASSDPKGQLTVVGQIFYKGNFTTFVFGTVPVRTPVTATLKWESLNHRFAVKVRNNNTDNTIEGTMPYSYSDVTPAVSPYSNLQVSVLPANCTAKPTWVYTESLFDNVYVTR